MPQDSIKTNDTDRIDWSEIDIAFLDLDGTVLDLNYDNTIWNDHLPVVYAEKRGLTIDTARAELFDEMKNIRGTIEFYSLDYWERFTGLDMDKLHRDHANLVTYRHNALAFLRWLKSQQITTVLATNAHRRSLGVKNAVINFSAELDQIVSSQDFQIPKEDVGYWHAMLEAIQFDPSRAFFADDNEPVLAAARQFGIVELWHVSTPDSQRSRPPSTQFPSFDDYAELCPDLQPAFEREGSRA